MIKSLILAGMSLIPIPPGIDPVTVPYLSAGSISGALLYCETAVVPADRGEEFDFVARSIFLRLKTLLFAYQNDKTPLGDFSRGTYDIFQASFKSGKWFDQDTQNPNLIRVFVANNGDECAAALYAGKQIIVTLLNGIQEFDEATDDIRVE